MNCLFLWFLPVSSKKLSSKLLKPRRGDIPYSSFLETWIWQSFWIILFCTCTFYFIFNISWKDKITKFIYKFCADFTLSCYRKVQRSKDHPFKSQRSVEREIFRAPTLPSINIRISLPHLYLFLGGMLLALVTNSWTENLFVSTLFTPDHGSYESKSLFHVFSFRMHRKSRDRMRFQM